MKKAILLLLGLFVAGLAAFAVPKEIKKTSVDQVIKVFVISENQDASVDAITFDIVDADVGEVASDELSTDDNDQDLQAALHSELFRLDISWQYFKDDFLLKDQGKPMQYINQIRHPVHFYRNL